MKGFYIKNIDLLLELKKSRELDVATIELINMWYKMARNLSHKFSYEIASDREDCLQRGVINCWRWWRSFDPEKNTNAFAYFTQVIKSGFAQEFFRINKKEAKKGKRISLSNVYGL
jgi:DNA-directed RNA polymerase specialized sigma subunit